MLTNHINPVDLDLIHEAVHEDKILFSQCCMVETTGCQQPNHNAGQNYRYNSKSSYVERSRGSFLVPSSVVFPLLTTTPSFLKLVTLSHTSSFITISIPFTCEYKFSSSYHMLVKNTLTKSGYVFPFKASPPRTSLSFFATQGLSP